MALDPHIVDRLEAAGEEAVRSDVLRGLTGNPGLGGTPGSEYNNAVLAWLKSKDDARAEASSTRKEDREKETLSIARKALRNSDRATWIATSAIVLSIIMAIQKLIEWFSK